MGRTDELQRFIQLYRAKVEHTLRFIRHVPAAALRHAFDPGFMPTIADHIEHVRVAEDDWSRRLLDVGTNDTIGAPPGYGIDAIGDVEDLRARYGATVDDVCARISGLGADQLEQDFSFAGRRLSKMAFLWSMLTHHTFHLGQVEFLMRRQGIEPVGFFPWTP